MSRQSVEVTNDRTPAGHARTRTGPILRSTGGDAHNASAGCDNRMDAVHRAIQSLDLPAQGRGTAPKTTPDGPQTCPSITLDLEHSSLLHALMTVLLPHLNTQHSYEVLHLDVEATLSVTSRGCCGCHALRQPFPLIGHAHEPAHDYR